ncbi:hypothetical protein PV04_04856 [Phialophora macrospora]|uniref:Zn(2)-C6 fungal-type domain-containing protein n=1 Tax=Phialophora macrospora TaxID=1851006 RepID=A0A0D2FQW8_9EURO|nr:hypothetical protein PV04_04856 [Phialophora macrospora]
MKAQRPGSKPNAGARSTVKENRRASLGRTPRACDRCRVKKAKCDGAQVCKACQASDIPCVYSARRREARNYYCQMREVTDTALQRLYWACRRKTGFPGRIPDESTGVVSTTDILKGLGLINPEFDEFDLPKEIEPTVRPGDCSDRVQRSLLLIKPRGHDDSNDSQSVASADPTSSSPPVLGMQAHPTDIQATKSLPARPYGEIDTKDQFLAYSPAVKPVVRRDDNIKSSSRHTPFFHQADHLADSQQIDVDAFLDVSFCAPATSAPQSVYNGYRSAPSRTTPTAASHLPDEQAHPSPPDLIYDGFLSPWPGSLAAAHRSVAI